jgi:hypothetical protein
MFFLDARLLHQSKLEVVPNFCFEFTEIQSNAKLKSKRPEGTSQMPLAASFQQGNHGR